MLSFFRDLLRTRLQLGYLLLSISVAAIVFSSHRNLSPGAIVRPRPAAAAAPAPPCPAPANAEGLLSLNAPQLASIERYVDATKPICSPHITTDVGTDPKLGIEADIAKWCRAMRRLSPPPLAVTRALQVPGLSPADAGCGQKLRAGGCRGERGQRLDVRGRRHSGHGPASELCRRRQVCFCAAQRSAARGGSHASSVIDVGCGDGYFLSKLLHFYPR